MRKLLKRYNKLILVAVLAALVLMIPLYPKFPLLQVSGTYVAIRLEDFLVLFAMILTGAYYLPKMKSLFEKKIERAIFLFLGIALLSVVSGVFVTKTIGISIGILHWLRRIEYMAPFFFAVMVFEKNKKDLTGFIVKLLLIVVAGSFLFGVGQKYFSWPVIVTQNQEYSKGIALRYSPGGHLVSTFAGHYDLGAFLVLVLPIFVSTFFLIKEKKEKVIIGIVVIAGLWLLSNTLSRISVFSYFVGVSTTLLFLKKYKQLPLVLLISFIVILFSSNLLDRYLRVIDVYKDRLIENSLVVPAHAQVAEEDPLIRRRTIEVTSTPTPVFEDRSTTIRLQVEWPRAVRAFTKNPLLGTGYSSITLATDNDFLRLLGEVGLFGFLAFFLIFANLIKLILKILPLSSLKKHSNMQKAFMAGFLGALPGVFTNASFIDVFEASKFAILFWLLLGVFVSLARKK